MKNVQTAVSKDGKTLTIKIDLTQDFGFSASGKTIIVGSTAGNKTVTPDGVVLGLNCYKYPSKAGK